MGVDGAGFSFEYKVCQEEGVDLENAFGPGLTGLVNLGSSCYINSVMQMLATVPDFVKNYADASRALFQSMDPVRGQEDFNWQLVKLVQGMVSGAYSVVGLFSGLTPPHCTYFGRLQSGSDLNGIKPKQFRRVVGRGHVEFSTAQQQDVEEYIR